MKALILVFKGIAMGTANKIPGVSGGVIALVFGFYEKLLNSFQKLNLNALHQLLNFQFRSFWTYINGSFLFLIFFFCQVIMCSMRLVYNSGWTSRWNVRRAGRSYRQSVDFVLRRNGVVVVVLSLETCGVSTLRVHYSCWVQLSCRS